MISKKKYKSLRFHVIFSILIFIVLPILLGLSFMDFFAAKKQLYDSYKALQQQTEHNITTTLKLLDNSNKYIEKSVKERAREAFIPFIEAYKKVGGDPSAIDLQELKSRLGESIELYIINKSYKIEFTTKKEDKGLDFSKYKGFKEELDKIREGNKFVQDRVTKSITTGDKLLFFYMPSPDNEYILELSIDSDEYKNYISGNQISNVIEELKMFNSSLEEIKLFDAQGRTESQEEYRANEEEQKIINKLWNNKNEIYEVKDGDNIIRFLFINLHDKNYPTDRSKVMKLRYSTTSINNKLISRARYYIASCIIGIVLCIFITFVVSLKIIEPIQQIINDVKIISKGDLHHKISTTSAHNRELKVLEESINSMVDHTNTYIEQIKEASKENKKLQEEEEALIRFATDLNEQTMTVGQMEQELKKKSAQLEKLNKKLNQVNRKLKDRNEELREELEMARRVQENIIPDEKRLTNIKELSFGSKYSSMEAIGGDLYDIIKVRDEGYGFLIADVSGHGVPAALITTMAKVAFTTHAQFCMTTDDVCQNVNKDLVELIGDLTYFLTAYYSFLNLKTGHLQYTNAGHHPAILYRKQTHEIHELKTEGTILGAFQMEIKFGRGDIVLEKGDRVLFITDGIIEAKNKNDELFGYDRLLEYIKDNSHLSPKEFVSTLIDDVNTFCNGQMQDDDRAILYFEYNPDYEEDGVKIEARKDSMEDININNT